MAINKPQNKPKMADSSVRVRKDAGLPSRACWSRWLRRRSQEPRDTLPGESPSQLQLQRRDAKVPSCPPLVFSHRSRLAPMLPRLGEAVELSVAQTTTKAALCLQPC